MKLSEKIQSKIDKQKFVGHDNAAVITYKMLEEWIEDAIQLEQNSHKHSVMQAEGSDGVSGAAVGKEREAKPVRVRTKMFQCKCGYETDSSLMWSCHADSCSA